MDVGSAARNLPQLSPCKDKGGTVDGVDGMTGSSLWAPGGRAEGNEQDQRSEHRRGLVHDTEVIKTAETVQMWLSWRNGGARCPHG